MSNMAAILEARDVATRPETLRGNTRLYLEWSNPVSLSDGSKQDLIYVIDWKRLPENLGI
jgi:hypothetical protein